MKVEGCCTPNMSDWRTTNKFKDKSSQTPGKTKGESCVADALSRFLAGRSRSYKHPYYKDWCKKMDLRNGIKR